MNLKPEPQPAKTLLAVLAVAVGYFVTGRLGVLLAIPPGLATPVWLPSGLALAALMLRGRRLWPGIWLGSFLVNLPTLLAPGTSGPFPLALGVGAVVASGSTLQALVAAALARRFIGGNTLNRVREVVSLIAIAAASCLVASTLGTTTLALSGLSPWNTYGITWLTWWLGDLSGILLVVPLLLTWRRDFWDCWGLPRRGEAVLFAGLLVVTCLMVFGNIWSASVAHYPLAYWIIPFLVWAGIRFGRCGVVVTAILISGMAIFGTLRGWGPFAHAAPHESLLLLQTFMSVCILTGLVLATAMSEREQAEEHMRRVFESASSAMIIVNAEGHILQMNRQTEELFGYSSQELVGQQVELLVPGASRIKHPDYRRGFMAAPQSRPMGAGRDLFGRRKDGKEVPIEIGLNPMRSAQGMLVVASVVDITERKKSEEALQQFNATLERQVAVRTAEAEHRAAQLRALAGELTQVEQRERRHLAQVLHDHVQQLLVASKIHLETAITDPTQPELKRVLHKVEELLIQSIADVRSLAVELSPPVLRDAGLVAALHWLARQMAKRHHLEVEVIAQNHAADRMEEDLRALVFESIRELLFNVTKHAGVDEARVTVAQVGPEQISISVEDSGVGFDPALLVERGAGADAEHFGLFSIRERLSILGGKFEVHSSPGQGTRTTIVAPIRSPVKQVVAPPAASSSKLLPAEVTRPSGGAIRVLIADDHKIVREGIVTLLARTPWIEVVGEAGNGLEAVELSQKLCPDVVVMDITMPYLNGIEATRRIKALLPRVKVLGLSMHAESDAAEAMMSAGAASYLRKDGPGHELIEAIRKIAPEPSR